MTRTRAKIIKEMEAAEDSAYNRLTPAIQAFLQEADFSDLMGEYRDARQRGDLTMATAIRRILSLTFEAGEGR